MQTKSIPPLLSMFGLVLLLSLGVVSCGSAYRQDTVEFMKELDKPEDNPLSLEEFALHQAAELGNFPVVQDLVDHQVNVNAVDQYAWTALHFATREGYDTIASYLIDRGADFTIAGETSVGGDFAGYWTPVHLSAWNGRLQIFKLLTSLGADLSARVWIDYGSTPLHLAAEKGYYEIVQELINQGVEVDSRNEYAETPLHLSCFEGYYVTSQELINAGANVNVQDDLGYAPLHDACEFNFYDLAEMLLRYGADVNISNHDGLTPLHLAAAEGNIDIMNLLLESGADINRVDGQGQTPLHLAVIMFDIEGVEFLVSQGADLSIQDNEGKTPYDLAEEYGYKEITNILMFNSM